MKSRFYGFGPKRQDGFSLVELMVAITLGLFILAGMTTVFVNNSRTRGEIERSNRQIENGRYAMQVLGDDLRLSGYLAEFDLGAALTTGLALPATKPNPCITTVAAINGSLPLHIQGYDVGDTPPACLTDVKAGTDIVVIRRASSCKSGDLNCADVAGAPYFQASLCNGPNELGSPSPLNFYNLDTNTAGLTRTLRNCATLAPIRRYIERIYYVANNDVAGDGIPTLKRAELGAGGAFTVVPIAQGIENMQLEYGIDPNGVNQGVPSVFTASPDLLGACAPAQCVMNWRDTVSVKVYLLARNTEPTFGGYSDTKTYVLGLNAAGNPNTVTPAAGDQYKRHVYQAELRLVNPAGRREQ